MGISQSIGKGVGWLTEQELMKRIQAAVSMTGAKCFRTNVGTGWTGDTIRRNQDGSITIFEARPFSTGLPRGFPDLLTLCADGQTALMEVKTKTGRLSEHQKKFQEVVKPLGHTVTVVRSVEEALDVCRPRPP